MVDVHLLTLPNPGYRAFEIYPPTEESLMSTSPENWEPIVTTPKLRVIDGLQRVLVARKHGIKQIPHRVITGE